MTSGLESGDEVVLRIAYAGRAESGKTTNLTALGEALGAPVVAPGATGARTVFFDWMSYTGGLFEGRRIRCELISVPGQEMLAARRRHLLQLADVVVLVVDTSVEPTEDAIRAVDTLRASIDARDEPDVGLVVQANKVDLPPVTSLEALRDACARRTRPAAVVTAAASEQRGVRETFVLAVRAGLDRLRNRHPDDEPAPMTGDDLKRWLDRTEASRGPTEVTLGPTSTHDPIAAASRGAAHASNGNLGAPSAAGIDAPTVPGTPRRIDAPATAPARATAPSRWSERDRGVNEPPRLPIADLPIGWIWPPVDGRMTLVEFADHAPDLVRVSEGGWAGTVGPRWAVRSSDAAQFTSLEAARESLLLAARGHASLREVLSTPRSVAIAETGDDRYRVWQVKLRTPSLREYLAAHLDEATLQERAELLIETSARLLEMLDARETYPLLPVATLDDVGIQDGETRYTGFLSSMAMTNEPSVTRCSTTDALWVAVRAPVRDWNLDTEAFFRALDEASARASTTRRRTAAERLMELLKGGTSWRR